ELTGVWRRCAKHSMAFVIVALRTPNRACGGVTSSVEWRGFNPRVPGGRFRVQTTRPQGRRGVLRGAGGQPGAGRATVGDDAGGIGRPPRLADHPARVAHLRGSPAGTEPLFGNGGAGMARLTAARP